MLSESSQVTKLSDVVANPFFRSRCPFGQNKHTNRCVEVIYCLDIYVEATEYLNSPISVVNLAQRNIENGKKGFANASDYLETWDDLDSITAVNA